jgi:beta-lactam-binding protein with PASTA domain
MNSNTPKPNFRKRHPVLMNLIYACLATVAFLYIALWFLDFWTNHGQERAVPDVKGQSFTMAEGNIERAGLRCVVSDSIYDSYARPGTVVEQTPIPSARIKKGGTVYLTVVSYSPKMVTFPDFYDVSERQVRSMLQGLGLTQIMTVTVPSEYTGLVLGAKFNGVSLRPGAKVPITAIITLEVGGELPEMVEDGTVADSLAIEEAIDALNIE